MTTTVASRRREPTQNERVLAMLKAQGARGVTQVDVCPPSVLDGGQPILRLPSRIRELRAAGHNIKSNFVTLGRGRARVARYHLTPTTATTPRPPSRPEPAQMAMLDEYSGHRPKCAIGGSDL